LSLSFFFYYAGLTGLTSSSLQSEGDPLMDAMIMRRGGGGAELNFRVVGGMAQPENPKENTIWVNTPTAISEYVFSAAQPSSPSSGMVWIFTGMSSAAEFNALKENGIQVYPISAKQYNGESWDVRVAKSYQGGKWVDWFLDLYKNGDEFERITGGWKTSSMTVSSNYSATAPTITKTDSYIRMSYNTGGLRSGGIELVHDVDLSAFNQIELEYSFTSGLNFALYLYIVPRNTTIVNDSYLAKATIAGEPTGVHQLGVLPFNVTGAYNIFVAVLTHSASNPGNGTVDIHRVTLK